MTTRPALLASLLCLASGGALAAGGPDAGTPRRASARPASLKVPKLDLGRATGAVPKGDNLEAREAAPVAPTPAAAVRADQAPQLVRVELLGASGRPVAEASASGSPLSTEPFSTRVHVRSAARQGGEIELVVLDPRGDSVMTSQGSLSFAGLKGDTAVYTVDWDPSPIRSGGDFQLLVRVSGQPLGTWPLKVVPRTR